MSLVGGARATLFWSAQALGLAVLALWLLHSVAERVAARSLPEVHSTPLRIEPLYDDPTVVSDQDLESVLARLGLPRATGKNAAGPHVGHVDHGLRMLGRNVAFENEALMASDEMVELLLDHRRFAEAFGRTSPPLLVPQGSGVRIRALEGQASSPHVDHSLATLLEIGVGLDEPIETVAGSRRVADLVHQSLADFRLDQTEYEWSILVQALLVEQNSWRTAEGRRIDFDLIADRLMRQRLPDGVCSGNHRLHTLVMLLRADALRRQQGQPELLGAAAIGRSREFLRDVTAMLVRNQHVDGYWDESWSIAPAAGSARPVPAADPGLDPLALRLIVTGHALEWWALAPEELQPPREVVRKAARWLVATIAALDDSGVAANYTFLTHAGRALALWRGRFPNEVTFPGRRG